MKITESAKIQEKIYEETLENGLTVFIVPRTTTEKKYVIWGTRFGSVDNHFIMPGSGEEVYIPDGVAHFLEHKMFEQPDGTNSLDTLMALGVDANAYTTNDHTAYLFECTDHFEEALAELMNYVQHPYFTDKNVEKEKGIIGQEIRMYDDDPAWTLYLNTMDCLYEKNPIKIDIAGTIESIAQINPDVLYKCYNTFYHPSNMILVVSGNVEPEEVLKTVKGHLLNKPKQEEIKRIYPEAERKVKCHQKVHSAEVSTPIFMIGILDTEVEQKDQVKKHMGIEIALDLLIGRSSKLYQMLYNEGNLSTQPDGDYEFSKQYAHVLLASQSKDPRRVYQAFCEQVKKMQETGISEEDFVRSKKKLYGKYVMEYNDIDSIARMLLADTVKGIQSFDYIERYEEITKEYVEELLKTYFIERNMVLSIVENQNVIAENED